MLVTESRGHAISVVQALHEAGHEAYFVGGCVRDQVMGLDPKDYDVATSAHPEEVEALFERTFAVGKAFGVVIVVHPTFAHVQVEVATFRNDGQYVDGRRPESVSFASAQEDAQRRDFTINGMFFDPTRSQLIDYVDGGRDIKARLVRAIGDPNQRFEEDKLRILRGVRFACRFNFQIEPATWQSMCDVSSKLREVSWERIRQELNGILSFPGRGRAFTLLHECGALEVVLPELVNLAFGQPTIYGRSIGMLDAIDSDPVDLPLMWLALLHGLDAETTRSVLNRMVHPKDFLKLVCDAQAIAPRIAEAPSLRVAELKRFLRREETELALKLERCLCALGAGSHEGLAYCLRFLREVEEQRRAGFEPLHMPMPIDGSDLQELGIPAGPHYRDLLGSVEDALLEGMITDREEAIALVMELWAKSSPSL